MTLFYNEADEQIDPLSLEKKYCFARGTIKIESIFIGTKISLQIKLYECAVKLLQTGVQRLLPPRPLGSSAVSVSNSYNPLASVSSVDSDSHTNVNASIAGDDDDAGSIDMNDEEIPVPPPAPVAKKVVRKIAKK